MTNKARSLIDVDIDDIILRIFILFVQSADAVLKYADAHFYRKAHLSVIKFMLLKILAVNDGTMTPSEIAKWTFRERHDITTLVDRLKQDGLVRTERKKRDRRFVNVTLTAKGWEVLKQTTPVAHEIVNQVMTSISVADAVPLENSFRVLRQNARSGLENLAERT